MIIRVLFIFMPFFSKLKKKYNVIPKRENNNLKSENKIFWNEDWKEFF